MINVIGACRMLVDNYPIPASPNSIKNSIINHFGFEPPSDIRMDLIKVLCARWKREGWTWDQCGAVKLEEDEEALFHSNGVSLIKSIGLGNPEKVMIKPVATGVDHPRVIWF